MLPEPSHPLEIRVARLEGSYEQIDKRLDRVEANLGRLEDKVEARFTRVETRFNQVDVKMDALRNLTFILFGALAGLVTVFEFIR